jgi:hypothetical protein
MDFKDLTANESARNAKGGAYAHGSGQQHSKLRGFLFYALISLVWLAFLRWLYASTTFVSLLIYALGNGAVRVEGLEGSVIHGINFGHLEENSESRHVAVDGLLLRYGSLLKGALQGEPRLDLLTIAKVDYEEIRLEKPSIEKVREDLLKVVGALEGIALAPHQKLRSVAIGRLEIGELSYRPALGAPALKVGPIVIEDFLLNSQGWKATKFEVNGEQLSVRTRPFGEHPRAIVKAQVAPEFFSNATEALSFTSN